MLQPLRSWLRARLARRLQVPEIPAALARLNDQGFVPSLIFDVGAYRGDFARDCLAVWPQARIVCFEPQRQRRHDLEALATASGQIDVYPMLLGSSQQPAVTLNVKETASSVLAEHYSAHPKEVCAQSTVDLIVRERYRGGGPDLLKVDVQGYELDVLKGAERSLAAVAVLLLELNLIDIHKGVPLIAEVIRWLDERGFVAYDVCGLTRRPLDAALWQVDMLLVPRDSRLRADKHWDKASN